MTDAAAIGHNNPPPEDALTPFRSRVQELIEAANAWLGGVKQIEDADTAKRCDDFLNQIKGELKALEDNRKTLNKPYEDWVKSNNAAHKPLAALLEKARDLLAPLKTGWLKREQDRIDAERRAKEAEALRKMKEAEDAQRAASVSVEAAVRADEAKAAADKAVADFDKAATQRAQVKGDYATRASGLRTYWSAVITDYPKALAHYGSNPKVREIIQQLADADARTAKESLAVPGVTPKSEQKAA